MDGTRTLTRAQAHQTLRERHACNGFCRGAEHVEVVWHTSDDLAYVTRLAVNLCDLLGVALVRLQPASPEARPPADMDVLMARPGQGIAIERQPVYGEHGYLMAWRVEA